MKILLVLITAGTLSPVIATVVTADQPKGVPFYISLFGYANTTVEDIEKFDKALCLTNGRPDTHDAHKRSYEQFTNCSDKLAGEVEIEAMSFNHGSREQIIGATIKGYCSRMTKFENCLKNLTESMKTCLDVKKHESADIMYNAFSKLFNFLCEDDAKHFLKASTRESEDCIVLKHDAVIDCANKTIGEFVRTTVTDGARLGGLGKLHLFVPDVNKCHIFQNFQQCASEELKKCDDQTLSEVINSALDIITNVLTCDYLLNSSASTATVVIVSLITVVIATALLYFAVNYLRTGKIYFADRIRFAQADNEE